MSWAKLDDRANEHPKQLAAGGEACWLWACGLMYANRQRERTGYIPEAVVPMLYPAKNVKRLASKLVDVGLWEKAKGGYQVHDFQEWNKSKDQVDAEREATRNRVAEHRRNKRGNAPSNGDGNGDGNADGNGVTPHDVPDPLPSSATPTPSQTNTSTPKPPVVVRDLETETSCPLDLVSKLERAGVFTDLADSLRVSAAALKVEAESTVAYWTIGAGMGRKRRNWPGMIRQRLVDRARAGEIQAPDDPEEGAPPEIRARLASLREGIGG